MTTSNSIKGTRSVSYDVFMETLSRFGDAEQELMQWAWGYYNGPLNRNKDEFARVVGCEWDLIQQVWGGREASQKNIAELFEAFAGLKRRLARQQPLVRTVVVERMIEALNYTRDNSAMTYITGPTGRGKTYAATAWASENNHGRSKYIRIQSDVTRRGLLMQLCRIVGVAAKGNTAEMEHNVVRALGPRNVIIVDEAGHLLSRSGRPGGPIELFRDLHDTTNCGVCFIFTDVYLTEIKRGSNADYFEQFLGRFEFQVEIPREPRRDEVRQILTTFYGQPEESLVEFALRQTRTRDGKLRTLFKDLFRARDFAASKGRPLSKDDLKAVVNWRKSGGAWPEDR